MSMRPFREGEAGYAGVGLTYCRVPLVLEAAGLAGADVVIVGAPFDEGVSYRSGTRFGPRAIRQAEDVGDPGRAPAHGARRRPLRGAARRRLRRRRARRPASLETRHANLRRALGEIYAAGAVSVVLGGDHSLSWPTLHVLAERHGPDGYSVVHLDTHADTGAELHGNTQQPRHAVLPRRERGGACAGRTSCSSACAAPGRSPTSSSGCATRASAGTRWTRSTSAAWPPSLEDAIAYARSRAPRTYLTVDIDVLDPAFAPGTGTPEPGGLTTRELLRAVRRIAVELDLVRRWTSSRSPRPTTTPTSPRWRAIGWCWRRCRGWRCARAAGRRGRSGRDNWCRRGRIGRGGSGVLRCWAVGVPSSPPEGCQSVARVDDDREGRVSGARSLRPWRSLLRRSLEGYPSSVHDRSAPQRAAALRSRRPGSSRFAPTRRSAPLLRRSAQGLAHTE